MNIEDATDTHLEGIINVGMPDNITEKFNVGDKVKIGFNGTTFETAPISIDAITIEKID